MPVLALVAAALFVGPATARIDSPTATPGPLAGLIKASKKESGLVFYGNPPSANWKVVTDRFQYYYPWIKTTSYDLDNNVIFSKYASESSQGIRTADVLVSSAGNLWVYATRQKYLNQYAPLELAKFPSFVQQYKGVYILSPDPAIIVYNKLTLKDKVPSSVTALANDASYGTLTGYTVDNLFGYPGIWGYVQKKGWGAFEKIGKSRMKAQTGVSGQLQLVSQGGANAAFLTSPTARFTIANNSSLQNILGWTYVRDAQPLIPRGIGITAKAKSPASAKLFLNWVYSKAGQQAMCDAGFTAFRNGFTPKNCANSLDAVYKAVGRANVIFSPFSQKFVNDYPRFKSRWHGIFG
ncbi:MAG: extracellular solute-binding protein [Thermoleophilia bacterium]|nr:extracellular solute-binding protein [Thermoleophilia bacterium]